VSGPPSDICPPVLSAGWPIADLMGTRLLRFVLVTSPPAAPLHPARPARAPIRAAAFDGPGRDCPGPLTTRGAGTAGLPRAVSVGRATRAVRRAMRTAQRSLLARGRGRAQTFAATSITPAGGDRWKPQTSVAGAKRT
jgi:hypothetical protein